MSWIAEAKRGLTAGHAVQVRPIGGSMRGRIESGQLVTLAPVEPADVEGGDALFIAWKGDFILHLVWEIRDGQFLIGNNVGKVNGWVLHSAILGKVIAVED